MKPICGLRICIVTEIFHPEDTGGMGKQAHALAERLIGRGLTVAAVTRKITPQSPDRETVGLVPVTRLPPSGLLKGRGWSALGPVLYFAMRLQWWLLCHARSYDVLLVQGTKQMLLPVFLTRLVGRCKCVLKVDAFADISEDVGPETLAKMGLSARSPPVRAWRALRNFLLRRADAVIAISSDIRNVFLVRGVDSARIHSIPNGIDMSQFDSIPQSAKAPIRVRLGLPVQPVLAIYSGRLSRAKGLLTLAVAWKSLTQRYRDIHLLIAGSGSSSFDNCEAELKDYMRRHGLNDTVSFLGQVPNVCDYLQAADLFVLPSDSEGFPLGLVEAMAVGLPSVVTRVSGAVDVVRDRDNGILIPIQDAGALEAAFEWLLRNRDQWESIGRKARTTVREYCELTSVTDRYLALFQSLAVR
jgi:glycosyltransferase involved in cell wall biosynthesis